MFEIVIYPIHVNYPIIYMMLMIIILITLCKISIRHDASYYWYQTCMKFTLTFTLDYLSEAGKSQVT